MVNSVNETSQVSLKKYIDMNRIATEVAEAIKVQNQNIIPAQPADQYINDNADIGMYSAFSLSEADWNNSSNDNSIYIDSPHLLWRSEVDDVFHQPDMKVWQDLYALANFFSTETDFETAFSTISNISIGWSFMMEDVQGQSELTDEIWNEFAAELERYAPLSKLRKFDSLLEYAAIKMTEIMRISAPEGAKGFSPLPDDYSDEITMGIMVDTFTKAFNDAMLGGSFFRHADINLWKALDVLVTPPEGGFLDERFYQYLKDNARQIFEEIKATTTPDPEKRFTLFGDLKAIVDTARQNYLDLTPVISQVFSEKRLFEI